jgi:hypothetical protein
MATARRFSLMGMFMAWGPSRKILRQGLLFWKKEAKNFADLPLPVVWRDGRRAHLNKRTFSFFF